MRVVALVVDLMDRSKITRAVPEVVFARGPDEAAGADVVIVDLGRHAAAVAGIRQAVPDARIVAYGQHTDADALARAKADGADAAVPRSRFFRDPAALLGGAQTSGQG